jgi:hypothetical protein
LQQVPHEAVQLLAHVAGDVVGASGDLFVDVLLRTVSERRTTPEERKKNNIFTLFQT